MDSAMHRLPPPPSPRPENMQDFLIVLWPEVEVGREAGDIGAGLRAGGDLGQP